MNTSKLIAPAGGVELSPLQRVRAVRGRVEKILAQRKLTQKWFYTRIGMSKTGFRQMWDNDSLKLSTLMKMAEVLHVPPSALVDDGVASEVSDAVAEPMPSYGKPRYLEDRVSELERELQAIKSKMKHP